MAESAEKGEAIDSANAAEEPMEVDGTPAKSADIIKAMKTDVTDAGAEKRDGVADSPLQNGKSDEGTEVDGDMETTEDGEEKDAKDSGGDEGKNDGEDKQSEEGDVKGRGDSGTVSGKAEKADGLADGKVGTGPEQNGGKGAGAGGGGDKGGSDSDIEEIEQKDPLAVDPSGSGSKSAGSGSAGNSRLMVVDSGGRTSGQPSVPPSSVPAHSRPPPPLTQYIPPSTAAAMAAAAASDVQVNPALSSALAQYGISTAGLTSEHLMQLQDSYRRAQQDNEFVLEAPSFIVPYVMESPARQTAAQFMERLKQEAAAAAAKTNGDIKDDAGENTSGNKDGSGDGLDKGETNGKTEGAETGSGDKEGLESNKENRPDALGSSRRDEDFSHMGKWAYYYQAPVGQFVLDQGRSIVEEFIKEDLLRQQKRKAAREKGGGTDATRFAIKSLTANLAASRQKNAPFRLKSTQCRYCAFETESVLVMERHLEMPHMVGSIYQCNFCDYEVRNPQAVLAHMLEEHKIQGRLERAPASFQCPLCPYEDSGKTRMTKHMNSCQKRYRADKNQALDDWTPPAKVPRIHRGRPNVLGKQFEPVKPAGGTPPLGSVGTGPRGRGRPVGSYKDTVLPPPNLAASARAQMLNRQALLAAASAMPHGMLRPPGGPGTQMMMQSPHYQIGSQIYQLVNNQLVPVSSSMSRVGSGIQIMPASQPNALSMQAAAAKQTAAAAAALKLSTSPSISITPVPRPGLPPSVPSLLRPPSASLSAQISVTRTPGPPGPGRLPPPRDQSPAAPGRGAFVICEICDGYIKDLEQLRNHMQWIHKVKIHPKMIYNRPPLNCQKCQLRFFTDQGLERHLLGSHGLVTSSMQEAANRGTDSGRCPLCGKVYQWKLLQHVAKEHHVTLKPAHLSYKCTVCTATFSMYKQFESHVYSSHSVVARKIMESSDRKKAAALAASSASRSGAPIRINDEITIIPHPSVKETPGRVERRPKARPVERECDLCDFRALPTPLLRHYGEKHLQRAEVEFVPLERDPSCAEFVTEAVREQLNQLRSAQPEDTLEVEVSDGESSTAHNTTLSKLNKEITITPVGGMTRPRRTITVPRPRPFVGPRSVLKRRRHQMVPRSVRERRHHRRPSVVELSDHSEDETLARKNALDKPMVTEPASKSTEMSAVVSTKSTEKPTGKEAEVLEAKEQEQDEVPEDQEEDVEDDDVVERQGEGDQDDDREVDEDDDGADIEAQDDDDEGSEEEEEIDEEGEEEQGDGDSGPMDQSGSEEN